MARHSGPRAPDDVPSSETGPPPGRFFSPPARQRPDVPSGAEVVGWGLFTSVLTTVLIAVFTRHWLTTLGIAALGITATGLLGYVAWRQGRRRGPI
jgi:hypothetical protein